MKLKYRAYISAELQKHCFADVINIPSTNDAQNGFWINKYGGFTRGEDYVMWIPPSQILFLKRVTDDGVNSI